jgi:hypothetical protein
VSHVDDVRDSFDEVIPGAAAKAGLFLRVIQDRAAREGLGLNFEARTIRKTQETLLVAVLQFGGTFFKGAPMKVIVHAEPIGSSLQVGWQLTEEELTGIMTWSADARRQQANRQFRNMRAEVQRQLSGILKAFHVTVFMPILKRPTGSCRLPGRVDRH